MLCTQTDCLYDKVFFYPQRLEYLGVTVSIHCICSHMLYILEEVANNTTMKTSFYLTYFLKEIYTLNLMLWRAAHHAQLIAYTFLTPA